MARLSRNGFLTVAVVFHLVYIFSIFDIYFVSPIVHGMQAFRADLPDPPAQRLVLIVGDGLRADKAFQSFPDPSHADRASAEARRLRPLAPFLRSRVLKHGTFGVSHTRVPTESRPGHVALIAGLYEDVSAVTTGWKLNPVNFDSVFNRSRHTWSWGSPDILPMFKEGAVPGRIDADTYGAEAEDFTQDATHLDIWVFDKVKALFKEAEHNKTLNTELRKDKNVFFLHLLGLDTTGHAYRPFSKEYLHNIKVVDEGVQEITKIIENFFADDKTAFVFTADHGMSDWGSHGDGHPDNTRTPLIAWGSGVAKPATFTMGTAPGHEDRFSSDWNLDHVQRHDVAQADVAALMAHLAGLEYPVNSVGELPLSYLNAGPDLKAKAMLANARGILDMYRVKESEKRAVEIKFQPFRHLSGQNTADARFEDVESLIRKGQYDEAITGAKALIKLGLDGMRYLQTYDWLFLRLLVTAGYLGWIAFALSEVVDLHVLQGEVDISRPVAGLVLFASAGVALFAFLFVRSSSWTYYAYAFFPVVFWEEVYARRHALIKGKHALLGDLRPGDYASIGFAVVAFVGLLEALVQSYFYREVYTMCYLAAIAWPAFYGSDFTIRNYLLILTWVVSCGSMSVFTLLPAIKTESVKLILLGGAIMFAIGYVFLYYNHHLESRPDASNTSEMGEDGISRIILGVQVGLIALAMLATHSSVNSLQARRGLPLGTQVVGWLVLVASLSVPFLNIVQPNTDHKHRLMVLFLAFSPMFIILTISYEGLFYLAFCSTLVSWVQLEHRLYLHLSHEDPSKTAHLRAKTTSSDATPISRPGHREETSPESTTTSTSHKVSSDDEITGTPKVIYRPLTLSDARISLFFLFALQSAFFSVGNIASISSFSLDAVYRLIPIFDPFSQGALLMLKILTPFVFTSAVLGILNLRLRVAPSALFMVVTALSEWLTIRFFWEVRDEGSWLDIGESITRFVIASLLGVFVAGLELGSGYFVRGVRFDRDNNNAEAVSGAGTKSNGFLTADKRDEGSGHAAKSLHIDAHVNGGSK